MREDQLKLRQLAAKGYCCAQIMVQMGLDAKQEENPSLLAAARGLCGGLHSGMTCGALSGAACMLALIDPEHAASELIPELTAWFAQQFGKRYGSCDCRDILEGVTANRVTRCPILIEETYRFAAGLLAEYGFEGYSHEN